MPQVECDECGSRKIYEDEEREVYHCSECGNEWGF